MLSYDRPDRLFKVHPCLLILSTILADCFLLGESLIVSVLFRRSLSEF